ncbi:uncharacterized protein [Miscanthus floridulus]|uniref:uncharacterized protein n=1 Tax=Miscanthus floridulus TaxID=154761 RepID=UPI0034581F26
MDGTHIEVIVDKGVRDNHINRKRKATQNVVAISDFNMRFTYVGVGTEGSAHDMRVKRKAETDASFPHPPSGRYYLADSGYALRPGYLMPYPNKRYWVKEFQTRGPIDAQELFNRHHSKLRNVIERTFGAAKVKWQMLKGIPHYPGIKQT